MIFFLTLFEFANKVSSSSTQCTDPNCIECEDDQVECLLCSNSEISSYDLVNGKCLAIPCEMYGCSVCGSSGCDNCSLGFYMQYGQTDCRKKCGEYCLECSGWTCSSCVNGFYLYHGYCGMCKKFCKVCSNSNTCEECYSDYKLEKDMTCVYDSPLFSLIFIPCFVFATIWIICM